MKVVSLSSRKGGAGKSTIAVHLAVASEALGLRTAIFDLDPQASAALWSDHRGEGVPAVVPAQAPRLKGLLAQAVKGGADIVFLDTPPHADGVSADAGSVADLILIPCRASAFDLDAIGATLRLAAASKKPAFVVINAAPVQGVEVAETREALQQSGVKVCPIVLRQRKAYAAQAQTGRTASEIEPGGKADKEVQSLLSWLLDELKVTVEQSSQLPVASATKKAGSPSTKIPRLADSKVTA